MAFEVLPVRFVRAEQLIQIRKGRSVVAGEVVMVEVVEPCV